VCYIHICVIYELVVVYRIYKDDTYAMYICITYAVFGLYSKFTLVVGSVLFLNVGSCVAHSHRDMLKHVNYSHIGLFQGQGHSNVPITFNRYVPTDCRHVRVYQKQVTWG